MSEAWSTVVEREPEWDDETRFQALALDLHDKDCCPGCGLHSSILDNPTEHVFTFVENTCAICKAQDIHGRVLAEADAKDHEAHKDRAAKAPRPSDGRHVYMRRVMPDEIQRKEGVS